MATPLSTALRAYHDLKAGKPLAEAIPRGVSRATIEELLATHGLPTLPTSKADRKDAPFIATGGAYTLIGDNGTIGLSMALAEAFAPSLGITAENVLYAYLFKNGVLCVVVTHRGGDFLVVGKLPQVTPNLKKYGAEPVRDVPPGFITVAFRSQVRYI